jgi:UDP-2,3-diacylglucosamine hydrolase
LHHPLSNWLYRLLHPDLGMAIALGVGRLSRNHNGNTPRHLSHYETAARALLKDSRSEILIHGHIHAGFVKKVPEGIYVNTGEWLERLQYVEMKDGECFLRTYNAPSSRLMASSLS